MIRFLARRLLNYVVLLLLASFLAFCLASLMFHPLESLPPASPEAAGGGHPCQNG